MSKSGIEQMADMVRSVVRHTPSPALIAAREAVVDQIMAGNVRTNDMVDEKRAPASAQHFDPRMHLTLGDLAGIAPNTSNPKVGMKRKSGDQPEGGSGVCVTTVKLPATGSDVTPPPTVAGSYQRAIHMARLALEDTCLPAERRVTLALGFLKMTDALA